MTAVDVRVPSLSGVTNGSISKTTTNAGSSSSSQLPTPEPPVRPLVWRLMLIGGVLLYSSYTILVHLCEENGKVPFSFMAVVLCIEILKLLLSAFMFMLEVAKANARPSAADESSVASVGSFFSALRERLRAEFSPHSPGYSTTTPSTVGSPVCHLLLIITPFAVPAVLYTITNNLGLAIQLEMDPATYQARFSVPS
uniref:Transmembrane protein n=1 Tax=Schistocephalus solidus TaxID=70667 RepID=A0A0X3PRF2_SCHSO